MRSEELEGDAGALLNIACWKIDQIDHGKSIIYNVKGQSISKAIYGLLTSPKKQTDEFVLFAFLLFTANKSNSSIRFLGESTARQSAFWFYLTFSWSAKCLL
jgi:hypothetical protein